LVPVVDDIVSSKQGVVDEQHILDVLNEITMVGLLPVPHPIVIRKYQPNQYTALWFTAFLWGVIFLRNQDLPLFDGQCVELFHVSVNDEEDDEE
jgi:Dyggve-Melchior-Clausen syndrome protein